MSVISSTITSNIITGVAVAGYIAFALISELTNVRQKPVLIQLNRSLTVFSIPLVILFAYTAIMLSVKILAG
jgi:hypothetical protein